MSNFLEKANQNQLDEHIKKLVNALNSFQLIHTIGSCGGHKNPTATQWEEGTWYVKFEVEESTEGLRTIEFLAWAINEEYDDDLTVFFMPKSTPPWLNKPNKTLAWVIEGYNNQNPDKLAEFITQVKEDFFTL